MDDGDTYYRRLIEVKNWMEAVVVFANGTEDQLHCEWVVVGREGGRNPKKLRGGRGFK